MKIAFLTMYFILAAIMTGLAIPILGPKYGVLMLALFATPVLFVIPAELMLFLLLSLSLVIAGLSAYFFKASLQWVVYLTGLAGYLSLLIVSKKRNTSKSNAIPLEYIFLALFVLCLVFSTAIDLPGPYHLLVAIRDYFFLMSAFFLVARIELSVSLLKKLWLFLWICALIQVPVALYQYFFVAAKRLDQAKWDAVVGTFSGFQEGGGDSGNLTIFMFSVLVLTIALHRQRLVSHFKLIVLILSLLIFVAISEVKVAFILLAIVGLWLLFEQKNITVFSRTLTSIFIAMVMGGLMWGYGEYRQDDSSQAYLSVEQRLEKTLSYSVETDSINARGDMGRIASLAFWNQKNSALDDPFAFFLGHGAGSTLLSREGYGSVAQKYFPLSVNTNAASVLLWDSGLIGTVFYVLFIFVALKHAWAAREHRLPNPWLKGFISAAVPILFFYTLTLFYNKGLITNSPPSQLMFFVFLGVVSNWASRRQVRMGEESTT